MGIQIQNLRKGDVHVNISNFCPSLNNYSGCIIEAFSLTQIAGVSSFSLTGTHVHQFVRGKKEVCLNNAVRTLSWFPAQQKLDGTLRPNIGFFIIGSWDNWNAHTRMQEEGPGHYCSLVELESTDNATFQIWFDDEQDKVLHPRENFSEDGGEVCGPRDDVGQDQAWMINAKSKKLRFITPKQQREMDESCKGDASIVDEIPCRAAFEDNEEISSMSVTEMPVIETNPNFAEALPQTYKVCLYWNGAYRHIFWTKVSESISRCN